MPKCKCACHVEEEKSKFQTILLNISQYSQMGFRVSIWVMIILFLMGGSYASIIMMIKMFPEFVPTLTSFLTLSSKLGEIGLYFLGIALISTGLYYFMFRKKKEKGGELTK